MEVEVDTNPPRTPKRGPKPKGGATKRENRLHLYRHYKKMYDKAGVELEYYNLDDFDEAKDKGLVHIVSIKTVYIYTLFI